MAIAKTTAAHLRHTLGLTLWTLISASTLALSSLTSGAANDTSTTAATTPSTTTQNRQTAIFAAGCFWCIEADLEKLQGVIGAVSGFTGGTLENPTYKGDHRGHYEAVEVSFDTAIITYEELLQAYWRNVDPFDADGQFCDRGDSYRGAIFVADATQRHQAEASKLAIADTLSRRFPSQTIVTPIVAATRFWPVEEYHQNYAKKNPLRYRFYRGRCGRDKRLETLWPDRK